MKRNLVALVAGALFSVGLALAGMTQPRKVLAFLDLFGHWDPSLAVVMVGGIAVSAVAFRVSSRLPSPALDTRFHALPTGGAIRPRLLLGAAMFGVGWGLSGLCPGPAVASLASGNFGSVVFVGAMLAGMALHARFSDAKRPGSFVSLKARRRAIVTAPHRRAARTRRTKRGARPADAPGPARAP